MQKIDLKTKIKNYIEWYLQDCDSPVNELEYLITLIIDSGGKEKEKIMEVLDIHSQNK